MAHTISRRSLSQQKPGFVPRSVHVVFVVDKMSMGHDFLRVIGIFLSIFCYGGSLFSYHLGDEK
jgi:hypothetical protein